MGEVCQFCEPYVDFVKGQKKHTVCLGGDEVALLVLVEVGDALDGQVVRFGRARGEDDFLRVCANQVRYLQHFH